jgi:hypothetical protein
MKNEILTTIVTVCLAAGGADSLLAQRAGGRISATRTGSGVATGGLLPTSSETSSSGTYSTPELEELRTQLLNLGSAVEEFAAIAPPNLVDMDSIRQAKTQIQQMPYEFLNNLRKGVSPSKVGTRVAMARVEIKGYADQVAQRRAAGSKTLRTAQFTDSTAFPSPSGICNTQGSSINPSQGGYGVSGGSGSGSGGTVTTGGSINTGTDQSFTQNPSNLRIPTSVVLAADVVKFVADTIQDFSQDACKEVVFGFNASLVCIAVDALAVIADAIDEGIHFCDDDLTGNVIDTSYNGLVDIHTDLYTIGTSIDTHVGTANTDIDTNITNATTTINNKISTANTDIDTKIANANTDIDTKIASLDTHLTNVDTHIANEFVALTTVLNTLISSLSTQVGSSTDKLNADLQQLMKLVMTPDGLKVLIPSILTCDGSAANPCPAPLAACQPIGCAFNRVGPLP